MRNVLRWIGVLIIALSLVAIGASIVARDLFLGVFYAAAAVTFVGFPDVVFRLTKTQIDLLGWKAQAHYYASLMFGGALLIVSAVQPYDTNWFDTFIGLVFGASVIFSARNVPAAYGNRRPEY